MNITVMPGIIVINEVSVVAEAENFAVLEADCHSKYAEISAYGASRSGRGRAVLLNAGDHTLRTDADRADFPTEIVLTDLPAEWEIAATAARYTVRIFTCKPGTRQLT